MFQALPKPERGYNKRNVGTKNRDEGTKNGTTVPKTGTRVNSPKAPFCKTTLLFPLETWGLDMFLANYCDLIDLGSERLFGREL